MTGRRSIYFKDDSAFFTAPDESEYCPICESYNGHSLSCATLNVNNKIIESFIFGGCTAYGLVAVSDDRRYIDPLAKMRFNAELPLAPAPDPIPFYDPTMTEAITASARDILDAAPVPENNRFILNDVDEITMWFDFPSGLLNPPRYVHEPKRQASHKLTPLERHQQSQRDKRAMLKRSRR